MKQDETRLRLIEGTIRTIAREGLDKASTKQIGLATSINEAYIYRFFEDKDDLLCRTFEALDNELVLVALSSVSALTEEGRSIEEKARTLFRIIWRFMLDNSARCLAYIRLYYSPYFKNNLIEAHTERYKPLLELLKSQFLTEADVWMILNHILSTMIDFAVKVFNGQVQDSADTEEHVFRVVYRSVEQYFKK